MTARRPKRPHPDARQMRLAEWDRLLRERSYSRPLPPAVPLHKMGQRRDLADVDNPTMETHA